MRIYLQKIINSIIISLSIIFFNPIVIANEADILKAKIIVLKMLKGDAKSIIFYKNHTMVNGNIVTLKFTYEDRNGDYHTCIINVMVYEGNLA